MYSTCIFCDRSLGRNEVIEEFPVGRQLAFDPHKGRLWVVCMSCRRWNLSPIEERWEAVEECEIAFRELPTRVHSEEIGAAVHPEGLRLVRIGEPLPVEFAVCRYGETMARRARRHAYWVAAGIGVGGAILVGGLFIGFAGAGSFAQAPNMVEMIRRRGTRVSIRLPDGSVKKVHVGQVEFLNPTEESTIGLRVRVKRKKTVAFHGKDARRVASKIIPLVNRGGAKLPAVRDAVSMMADVGGPEAFLQETWGKGRPEPGSSRGWVRTLDWKGAPFGAMGHRGNIALEMALNQEQERKALEGELVELRAAWRHAEEMAQISDSLLIPEEVEDRVAAFKDVEGEEHDIR